MTTETRSNITISVDGTWAGDGKLCPCSGRIEDCSAQFCDDADESLAVYDVIEQAIDGLTGSVMVDVDGEAKKIEWTITEGENGN
jgi:hypothetical protein